jgi:hypothetical protein
MVDQRVAEIREILDGNKNNKLTDVIVLLLTDPPENATLWQHQHWVFACDNCNEFHQNDLFSGRYELVIEGRTVVLCFGACAACMAAP